MSNWLKENDDSTIEADDSQTIAGIRGLPV